MKCNSVIRMAGALAAVLLSQSAVLADNLPWKYNWTPSTTTVTASNSGIGGGTSTKLKLTNEPLDENLEPVGSVDVTGNSDIVATQIKVESNAPSGFPDQFVTGADVTFKLKITDGTVTSASHTFTFNGTFATQTLGDESTASTASANVKFTSTGDQVQSFIIGAAEYTVKFVAYTPPGPPGSSNMGSIAYNVKVRALDIQKAPEPASLMLAGLGASFMGFSAWRKKRRQTVEA
jgi:hypothetical protein